MLFFVTDSHIIDSDIRVKLTTGSHDEGMRAMGETGDWFLIDRNSIKSRLEAATLANAANTCAGKKLYTWTDQGPNHYPRFDVVAVPQVGDEVSYGFNGDYYPCGKIAKVSDFKALGLGDGAPVSCRRVEAREDNGAVHIFWRLGYTRTWKKDKTWSLVQGHRNERNPSF